MLYSVAKFDGYGKLSGKILSDLRAGARIEVDEAKRDPLDFVLWKNGETERAVLGVAVGPRPAGLAHRVLGDVEGGARRDVRHSRRRPGPQVPASRERDRAELRRPRGAKFVNLWMHNGFVNINNEKMSKSLGNFFTVREVFTKLRHPEVMRYFLLSSHYRGPINYAPDLLEQADAALNRIYTALRDLPTDVEAPRGEHTKRFHEVMDDDFNTPEALAVIQTLTREINTARDAKKDKLAATLGAELRYLAGVLGIGGMDPEAWFKLRGTGSLLTEPVTAAGRGRCRHACGAYRRRRAEARGRPRRRPCGQEFRGVRSPARRVAGGRRDRRGQAGRQGNLAPQIASGLGVISGARRPPVGYTARPPASGRSSAW